MMKLSVLCNIRLLNLFCLNGFFLHWFFDDRFFSPFQHQFLHLGKHQNRDAQIGEESERIHGNGVGVAGNQEQYRIRQPNRHQNSHHTSEVDEQFSSEQPGKNL